MKRLMAILMCALLVSSVAISGVPTLRSSLVAYGIEQSGNDPHWAVEWLAYGGITVGCGFIGLGVGTVTGGVGGFLVGSACDLGISA